ncbi:MAG: hypothetical protein Q4F06_10910, partial [Eubacteriales bacterium]|nr:hypothetical protein [Eubacteriales bacterium]
MSNKILHKMILKGKKAASVALAVAVTGVSIALGLSFNVKAGATSAEATLKGILGDAAAYGVVCDEFIAANHLETNLATNNLIVNGTQGFGNTKSRTNAGGVSFIKNFESGYLRVTSSDSYIGAVVFGCDYQFDDNQTKLLLNGGKAVFDFANYSVLKEKLYANYPDYMDVNSTIATVSENLNSYTKSDEGVVFDTTEYNNGKIDVTGVNKNFVTVSLTYAQFKSVAQFRIVKNDNQIVLINLTDINQNYIDITKYLGNYDTAEAAGSLVWNFGDYSGTICLTNVPGTFVAPNASVTLGGTCAGRAICKNFTNPNGEWHFYSYDLVDETTTATTTTEETTTQQETKTTQQ